MYEIYEIAQCTAVKEKQYGIEIIHPFYSSNTFRSTLGLLHNIHAQDIVRINDLLPHIVQHSSESRSVSPCEAVDAASQWQASGHGEVQPII